MRSCVTENTYTLAQLKTVVKSSQLSSFLSHLVRLIRTIRTICTTRTSTKISEVSGCFLDEILSSSFEISSCSCCLQGRNPSFLRKCKSVPLREG